jgi:hypothetical protein
VVGRRGRGANSGGAWQGSCPAHACKHSCAARMHDPATQPTSRTRTAQKRGERAGMPGRQEGEKVTVMQTWRMIACTALRGIKVGAPCPQVLCYAPSCVNGPHHLLYCAANAML